MASKTYTVVAPLVVAKLTNGQSVHIYKGGELPENVDKDQLKQLVDQEMVATGKAADEALSEQPADEAETPAKG